MHKYEMEESKSRRTDRGLAGNAHYLLQIPNGYELKEIDAELYDKCLESSVTADFVSSFGCKEAYLKHGRGVAVIRNGEIVSSASSYTRYREGIEIEVDTVEKERRTHPSLIQAF